MWRIERFLHTKISSKTTTLMTKSCSTLQRKNLVAEISFEEEYKKLSEVQKGRTHL